MTIRKDKFLALKPYAKDELDLTILELLEEGHKRVDIARAHSVSPSYITRHVLKMVLAEVEAAIDKYDVFNLNPDGLPEEEAEEIVEPQKPLMAGEVASPIKKRKQTDGKTFILTSAQNNTPVFPEFLENLEAFARDNDAEIIVGTFTYNKNGFHQPDDEEVYFDERIKKYIYDGEIQLAPDLVWCGDLNILPTATNPESGFENYLGNSSIVIPHTRMRNIPVSTYGTDVPTKYMMTTGTVTQRNYIQKKSGQKAQWHHFFSALLVEVQFDGTWYARHLNASSEDGSFMDVHGYYHNGQQLDLPQPISVTLPDIHIDIAHPLDIVDLIDVTAELNPEHVIVHDLHDQSRRNHHNMKDPHYWFSQLAKKEECVEAELIRAANFLQALHDLHIQVHVVESNHDLALLRWLKEANYKKDPVNALLMLRLEHYNYKQMAEGEKPKPFKFFIQGHLGHDCTHFLDTGDHLVLGGVEHGNHGDTGANGARGSVDNFIKQGTKFTIGHGHRPTYKDNVVMVGAAIRPENTRYARGADSWDMAVCLQHANGKRQLLIERNGEFWRKPLDFN